MRFLQPVIARPRRNRAAPGIDMPRVFRGIALGLILVFPFSACTAGNTEKPIANAAAETPLWAWTGDENYVSPRDEPIIAENLQNQSAGLSADWYRDAAFYHVWVKSFNDSDGDGCGDLDGITEKLGYIQEALGCDAIWLSPIFDCADKGKPASFNMHGYDTVDYYSINPYFGDETDLSELLAAAHDRGMKVIFDFVPNHTSSSHPRFVSSVRGEGWKGDWYLWQNSRLYWNPMGNSPAWHANAEREQYYYAPFWGGMPDLNYRNREVREEMKNVARYWLNRGFDGMRIDAVRYLMEEPSSWADTAGTHAWFSELRTEVVDAYAAVGSPKFMVGEAWINGDRPLLESYFGTRESPEFSMLFDFDFAGQVNWSINFASDAPGRYLYAGPASAESGAIASFLSNHDNLSPRPATLYGDRYALRLATALSLARPTVPFIYYGNEIGQKDAPGYTDEDVRLRYPLDWSAAAFQIDDPDSLLAFHKALLDLRRSSSALRRGSVTLLGAPGGSALPAGLMAYALSSADETLVCVFGLRPFRQFGPFEIDLAGLNPGVDCAPLFGDPSGASWENDVLAIKELGPWAARIYRIGSGSSAPFPAVNQESPEATMYLRGSMNAWGVDLPMSRTQIGTDDVWTVSLNLTGGVAYSFKFDSSGAASQWPAGQNWGAEPGNETVDPSGNDPLPLIATGSNAFFTPAASGNYAFTFNFTQKTVSIH